MVTGSAILFFFCFWLTKLFSLVQRLNPTIDNIIHTIVGALPKPEFVIKNDSGTFVVQAFDDSMTICSSYFEKELRGWLERTTTKDIFVDIGANRGIYTVIASHQFGFAKVHAFEPNPEVFTILQKNVTLNQIELVAMLHNAAIGDTSSIQTLAVDPMLKGGGKITTEQTRNDVTMEINIVTLDSQFTPADMGRVGFIKIDTEGYEQKVLSGMIDTLTHMPTGSCLMIETTEPANIKAFLLPYHFNVIESRNTDYLFAKVA